MQLGEPLEGNVTVCAYVNELRSRTVQDGGARVPTGGAPASPGRRSRHARKRDPMELTRYPDDPVAFLKPLRAVRSFERKPVSQETLDDVLEVARWSGSARNRQPWEFLVVRDR